MVRAISDGAWKLTMTYPNNIHNIGIASQPAYASQAGSQPASQPVLGTVLAACREEAMGQTLTQALTCPINHLPQAAHQN